MFVRRDLYTSLTVGAFFFFFPDLDCYINGGSFDFFRDTSKTKWCANQKAPHFFVSPVISQFLGARQGWIAEEEGKDPLGRR